MPGADSGERVPARDSRTAGPRDATPGVRDPDIDERWVRLRAAWRLVVVVYRFAPLILAYLRDRRRYVLFGPSRHVDGEAQIDRAQRLLDILIALGPTFIKIGQILSTRPDVLPGPYIAVLQQLQDRVPPADWARVQPVIEDELGPVADAFDEFDTTPISGASLGQVYTAQLDGERVAVKVLRPNIRRRVEADLRVIDVLTPLLVTGAEPGQAFTLENLADEFTETLREEMDYVHEARMLRTIRGNFADDPTIRIPRTIDSHCGEKVLTMEYVGGTKITDVERLDAKGIDRQDLVVRLQETYIQMVLEDGVFHADPHPGNLAVRDDGTLVFYDFGITGQIDAQLQEQIFEFYIAIAREDIDGIIDAFVAMGALDPTADRELMGEMFEIVLGSFRGEDVDEYQVQQLVADFQEELYEFPLRLPQNLALIVRVTTVLEGVARTLDPDFDLIEVITDYVREEGYAQQGVEELLGQAREELESFSRAVVTGAPRAERVLDRFERDDVTVQAGLSDENGYVDLIGKAVVLGLGFVAFVFAALVLFIGGQRPEAGASAGGAVLSLFLLWRSLRQPSGIRAEPQFTRQNLRQRQETDREGGYAESFGTVDPDEE